MARIVVLGAGGLTFGFVCPIAIEAGLEVIVASRIQESSEAPRLEAISNERLIRPYDLAGSEIPPVPIVEFIDTSTSAGLQHLTAILSDDGCLGFVAAARDGFASFVGAILDSLPNRSLPLVGVCADNSEPAGWRDLANGRSGALVVVTSVADRICIRFPEKLRVADVQIETHADWFIENAPGSLSEAISQSPSVSIVPTDQIEHYRQRKLLCVNGLQLALALLALEDGEPLLDDWIQANWSTVAELAHEVVEAFGQTENPLQESASEYVQATAERFRQTPDLTGRMLGLKLGQEYGNPGDLERRLIERIDPMLTLGGVNLVRSRSIGDKYRDEWEFRLGGLR